jgi:phosphohistidine phosphatase
MNLELILVRHAKSLYNDYVQNDVERHLSDRGYSDAADSANWLASKISKPDLLISSPAIRAYSTALIFANRLGYKMDSIQLDAAIYEAGVRQLLYVIAQIPPTIGRAILFGHNPGFTDFINHLCGPVCPHLPTSGVAIMNVPIKQGELPSQGSAKLQVIYSGHKPF